MKSIKHLHAIIMFISIMTIVFSCKTTAQTQKDTPSCNGDTSYLHNLDTADHYLPIDIAESWINRYYTEKSKIQGNSLNGSTNVLFDSSESFSAGTVQTIFSIKNCIGLRVLLGMDDSNHVHVLLAGIDPCGHTLYLPSRQFYMNAIGGHGPNEFNKYNFGGDGGGVVEMGQHP